MFLGSPYPSSRSLEHSSFHPKAQIHRTPMSPLNRKQLLWSSCAADSCTSVRWNLACRKAAPSFPGRTLIFAVPLSGSGRLSPNWHSLQQHYIWNSVRLLDWKMQKGIFYCSWFQNSFTIFNLYTIFCAHVFCTKVLFYIIDALWDSWENQTIFASQMKPWTIAHRNFKRTFFGFGICDCVGSATLRNTEAPRSRFFLGNWRGFGLRVRMMSVS